MSYPEQVTNATSAVTLKPSAGREVGCLGQGNLIEGRCPKDEGVAADVATAAGAWILTSACVADGSIFGGVDNGCFVRKEVCPGSTALGLS